MERLRLGIIGCGAISGAYLRSLTERFADDVEVLGLADLRDEASAARAEEFGVPRAESSEALLADDRIEIVLNLTPAPAHHAVSAAILDAGKHCYTEKPLALTMSDGRDLVERAKTRGLHLSAAPDTLLGAGLQTARKAIDDGLIGDVVTGHAYCSLHKLDDAYMTAFRGALLDLATYHVSGLLLLLGPVRRVVGLTREAAFLPQGSAGRTPDAPSTAGGVLLFASGAIITFGATNEATGYRPHLSLVGTKGRLTCADPNQFNGNVILDDAGGEPRTLDLVSDFDANLRGIGSWEMGHAVRDNRPHRLSAELALHALEVKLAIIESSKTGHAIDLETTCDRPTPLTQSDPSA